MRSTLFALLTFVALTSCISSSTTESACTALPCSSGLQIDLSSALPEGSRIEIFEVATPTQVRTVACTASQRCERFVFLTDYRPTTAVQIRVVTPGRTVTSAAVVPQYQSLRPNGLGCPPVCEVARLNAPTAPA